jgi:aconitate hydratase
MTVDSPEERLCFPDTLVGTDSHTTMVNGLGVVGWGVGGIEAEAAMLGQPISMLIPKVLGFRLTGAMLEGATATDLVLTITEKLRKYGVVGKFVEFFGPGLEDLTIADRATLGNMCPEYGATIAIFPIDEMTLDYLRLTGREPAHVALVEAYAKAQGMFRTPADPDPVYSETIELDLGTVEPSLAGPRRPQDRVSLKQAKSGFQAALSSMMGASPKKGAEAGGSAHVSATTGGAAAAVAEMPVVATALDHGAVVIAAITSCTNTSNPSVMIAAGLVAKRAVERGLTRKPWVKTSLAPGSKVVTEYLRKSGLDTYLDALGFNLVGYGCTTCIGNSGPLPDDVSAEVEARNLVVASVLSGNRNFEGRIQQQVRANYLASPPLVVAYALAGRMTLDLTTEPIGTDKNGSAVFLRELWPSEREIQETMLTSVTSQMFREQYSDVFSGDDRWKALQVPGGDRFEWEPDSTYIRNPPFFEHITMETSPVRDITGARVLALLGDSITTDHISPAGSIKPTSPAGLYLQEKDVSVGNFNSYGSRRGNHEVMLRGTFANVRIKNLMLPANADGSRIEGGVTLYHGKGGVAERMPLYDAAMQYQRQGVPTVVFGGEEYGTGSSRDWAAKGTQLLGIKAVIAKSFERIHRSNLVGMGVLPLQFAPGDSADSLGIKGDESFDIAVPADIRPQQPLTLAMTRTDGTRREIPVLCRIDTPIEVDYYRHGGILPFVLRELIEQSA